MYVLVTNGIIPAWWVYIALVSTGTHSYYLKGQIPLRTVAPSRHPMTYSFPTAIALAGTMVIKVLHLIGLFHVQQTKKGPWAIERLFLTPSHLSPVTGVYKLICIMNIPCLPLQSFA